MSEAFRLVLDIGGSYIKHAVATQSGRLLPETVGGTPACADGAIEEIYAAISQVIQKAREGHAIDSACVAMPGPFDFDTGVSHMTHKFPALLRHSLRVPFEQNGLDVVFLHDATAYILGEYHDGTLAGAQAPCCAMLGTGLGFAFMQQGRVCLDASQTPALRLWCSPYRNGIAEDSVSTRALLAAYDGHTSVKEMAQRAKAGDRAAQEAFQGAGRHLSAILAPVIRELHADRFSLGGQIAKSAPLLALELPIPWAVSPHLDDAALRGAAWYGRLGKAQCVRVLTEDEIEKMKRGIWS